MMKAYGDEIMDDNVYRHSVLQSPCARGSISLLGVRLVQGTMPFTSPDPFFILIYSQDILFPGIGISCVCVYVCVYVSNPLL